MNEALKLIEGMKKLKVLEKHIGRNTERIQQYASIASTERPFFAGEKEQEEEVKKLIQANKDLVAEYLNLKKRVDLTNLMTRVTIGKEEFALADLLILRRGLSKLMQKTFAALNDSQGQARLAQIRQSLQGATDKAPHVIRLYDENEKISGLQYWQGLDDLIEQRLEVINATTDMIMI
jgi:hypothetical protein